MKLQASGGQGQVVSPVSILTKEGLDGWMDKWMDEWIGDG
jgi:hypothetical protein